MIADTAVRGIVTCLDYDDYLRITLPRNMRHLAECVVVTAPRDERTKAVARSIPNVRVVETEAFFRAGAKFNKGAAINVGLEAMDLSGWVLIWDADTLFPDGLRFDGIEPGNLYSCQRRMLKDAARWSPKLTDWHGLPTWHDKGCNFIGYFQLFHASDPRVSDRRRWYDEKHAHAGGADWSFAKLWPDIQRVELPHEVLHLGPADTNWFGRVSARIDGGPISPDPEAARLMRVMVKSNGWERWEGA